MRAAGNFSSNSSASQKEMWGLNLPGWRWARIMQLVLVGSSSSLPSEACNALGGSDGVAHSKISLNGVTRPRGFQPADPVTHPRLRMCEFGSKVIGPRRDPKCVVPSRTWAQFPPHNYSCGSRMARPRAASWQTASTIATRLAILAEGAMALSMTLDGGALFAS